MADRGNAVRHVLYDANWWKSFVFARLGTSVGDPGAMTLFGRNADRHRLLAQHLTSERRIRVEARGRVVDEWRLKQPGLDNHWLDCLVGASVAASMEGVELPSIESGGRTRRKRRRVVMSEIMAQRQW